ncbi:MAG: tetratricopeptide repeat protein [Syntrophaceae bacterium]|jgi:tetratricopeptide (TPR) repeat protein|nr:tetratricopeptide repeat protein [Syntrophaceae bacterium]
MHSITIRQKKIIIILILSILTLYVYWQVQDFEFINYDDQIYVTQNYQVQSGLTFKTVVYSFTDTRTANWHPLTMLSHALDWQLFGNGAGGHHWTNLILHILNTVLLFLLLNAMTGAVWRSALVAALFAVHPINVESVAWVAERKNVLSTFFWFLTMLFYVWYVRNPGWKRYVPVFLCFALGLMTKPMLVTLPFVLLLMDYWPLNRTLVGTRGREEISAGIQVKKTGWLFLVGEKIPLFILTGVFVWITLYTQSIAGAVMSTASLPMFQRLANAIAAYVLYIRKMILPFDLSVFYPRSNIEAFQILASSLILIILSLAALRHYRSRSYILVGWLWFVGTMVPVIGFVQVGAQSMADRYAYVPFIGLFIVVVWAAADLAEKNDRIKMGVVLITVCIISAFSFIAWERCRLWGDSFALWNDTLKNHENAFAHNMRGVASVARGQYLQALTDYTAAIRLDKKMAEAFSNRAIVYEKLGQQDNALRDFNQAIQLKLNFADAYYNRGLLFIQRNRLDEAVTDLTTAINIQPETADYYNNRGVAFRLKGEYEKSFADINRALKLDPNFAEAYFNRGLINQIQRQDVAAVVNFSEALRIKPHYVDARFHRGLVFSSIGKHDQAIKDFYNVLKTDPNHIPTLKNLALTLIKIKRYEESYDQVRKVLHINPNDHEALKYAKEIEALKQ